MARRLEGKGKQRQREQSSTRAREKERRSHQIMIMKVIPMLTKTKPLVKRASSRVRREFCAGASVVGRKLERARASEPLPSETHQETVNDEKSNKETLKRRGGIKVSF